VARAHAMPRVGGGLSQRAQVVLRFRSGFATLIRDPRLWQNMSGMGPRSLRRVDRPGDFTPFSPEAPAPASGAASPASRPSRPAIRAAWSWVAILLIATLSGLGAFELTRLRLPPLRAAIARPATLTVSTQPAGADLFINGRHRGQTPLTLPIEPGSHMLMLRSAGGERSVPLTVTAGAQVAQYFELKPAEPVIPSARLSIVTDPPGALVSVDGRPRGVSPMFIEDLVAAEHRVTVTSGTWSAERRITIEPSTTKEVVFSLPRSSAPLGGWVSVVSPFQVDVLEHDEVVGTSGITKVMLPAGRHDLVLRNESVGYEARRSVDVVAGSVATIEIVPPNASLNVNARPWADVVIDGDPVGQTPLGNVTIAVGTHQITFRHPQLGERTQTVVVTAGGVNRIAVDLTK
jgi:PEGA domain-containing protein